MLLGEWDPIFVLRRIDANNNPYYHSRQGIIYVRSREINKRIWKKICIVWGCKSKNFTISWLRDQYALNRGLFNRIKGAEKNKSEEPKDMMGLGLFLDIQRSAECTRFPKIKRMKN